MAAHLRFSGTAGYITADVTPAFPSAVESLLGRESTTSDVTVPDWLRQYSPHGAEPIRRPPHRLLLPQPITGDL